MCDDSRLIIYPRTTDYNWTEIVVIDDWTEDFWKLNLKNLLTNTYDIFDSE